MSRHEEACGTSRVAVAVNQQNAFCGIYQVGSSGLPPSDLEGLFACAQIAAASVFSGLKRGVLERGTQSEVERVVRTGGASHPDVPGSSMGFFA